MAEALKVLGQIKTDGGWTKLYEVPAATSASVSSIVICNRTTGILAFHMALDIDGTGEVYPTSGDEEKYLYYDIQVATDDAFAAVIGITLAAAEAIWISGATGLSAHAFGVEVT
tara:strand:- start:62 stop:403 length:342 start_codon:yes stop_codon:yes gene_type:complete